MKKLALAKEKVQFMTNQDYGGSSFHYPKIWYIASLRRPNHPQSILNFQHISKAYFQIPVAEEDKAPYFHTNWHYENKITLDKKENSTNDPEKTTRTKVDFKFGSHNCHKIGHKAIDCSNRNGNSFSQTASQAEEAYTEEPITTQETVLTRTRAWTRTSHMSSELENFRDLKTFKRTWNLNFSTEIEGIDEIYVTISEGKSLLLRNMKYYTCSGFAHKSHVSFENN
ncbi:hypothetical protein JTB14_009742 [Gonioctena quinquepunctata]|nr:hypothetical protein JTB14_009742 [Gonioctena quinquepunctata]